jgi:hypothetical protein
MLCDPGPIPLLFWALVFPSVQMGPDLCLGGWEMPLGKGLAGLGACHTLGWPLRPRQRESDCAGPLSLGEKSARGSRPWWGVGGWPPQLSRTMAPGAWPGPADLVFLSPPGRTSSLPPTPQPASRRLPVPHKRPQDPLALIPQRNGLQGTCRAQSRLQGGERPRAR